MKSYAITNFAEPLEPMIADDPAPKGTEVIIEVTRCGICHTDLHIHEGFYDLGGGKKIRIEDRGVTLPFVMGHEIVGRLIAKGPDAPIGDDQIGRRFVAYSWLGCGECDTCRRGDENYCATPAPLGVRLPGGYSNRCVIPHPRYLVDIEGIDPGYAATLACSGLTTFSALKKLPALRDDEWLLLLGAGGLGMSALALARALGYRNIVVSDIDPAKRALAETRGARITIDPAEPDALAALQARVGGIAAAIDFVGAVSTAEFGLASLRRGGTYIALGLFGGEIPLSLGLLILRIITIKGSYVGSLGELKELIELVRGGKVDPLPIEELPLDDVNHALERLRQGKVEGRLVLTCS